MWAFRQLYKKGPVVRGLPGAALLLGVRDAPLQFRDPPGQRLPVPPGPSRHGGFRACATGRWAPGRGSVRTPGLPVRALVWTTTPWTLPSNLALAVGRWHHLRRAGDRRGPLPGGRGAPRADGRHPRGRPAGRRTGRQRSREGSWLGLAYRPLFDFFAAEPRAFRVLGADFVSTEEGTGIVHLAPGFGEDDQRACEQAGIAVVCPVDSRGGLPRKYRRTRVLRSSRPTAVVIRRPETERRPRLPRDLRALLSPLLADGHAARYTGPSAPGSSR